MSPLLPVCHRSAFRSCTDAPGPPCKGLLPSAPGSGIAAAHCTRSPLCLGKSKQTKQGRVQCLALNRHGIRCIGCLIFVKENALCHTDIGDFYSNVLLTIGQITAAVRVFFLHKKMMF